MWGAMCVAATVAVAMLHWKAEMVTVLLQYKSIPLEFLPGVLVTLYSTSFLHTHSILNTKYSIVQSSMGRFGCFVSGMLYRSINKEIHQI